MLLAWLAVLAVIVLLCAGCVPSESGNYAAVKPDCSGLVELKTQDSRLKTPTYFTNHGGYVLPYLEYENNPTP